MSVNAVRKLSSDQEVQILAKGLIKSWKKLLRKCLCARTCVKCNLFLCRKIAPCVCVCAGARSPACADGDGKDSSPVGSSTKDLGGSEKRLMQSHTDDVTPGQPPGNPSLSSSFSLPVLASCKASAESPASPTIPTRMASFPPAAVTSDSVRSRSRELLVVALQTDGEDEWRRCRLCGVDGVWL